MKPAADPQDPLLSLLPNIAELIDFGGITVGQLEPVGCVAIANTEDGCLAMLRLRQNETLSSLLVRLDRAIAKAMNEDIYTDEINTLSSDHRSPCDRSCPLETIVDTTAPLIPQSGSPEQVA